MGKCISKNKNFLTVLRAGVHAPRIRLWPHKREKRLCILIGAGVTYRSDWTGRVQAVGVSARSDR